MSIRILKTSYTAHARYLYIQCLPLLGTLLDQLNQTNYLTGLGATGRELALSSQCLRQDAVVLHPRWRFGRHDFGGRQVVFDRYESA